MSRMINGKPISTWNNEDLIQYLDELVCSPGVHPTIVVLSEALSRVLYAVNSNEVTNAKRT